jgi:hypothetical protein
MVTIYECYIYNDGDYERCESKRVPREMADAIIAEAAQGVGYGVYWWLEVEG